MNIYLEILLTGFNSKTLSHYVVENHTQEIRGRIVVTNSRHDEIVVVGDINSKELEASISTYDFPLHSVINVEELRPAFVVSQNVLPVRQNVAFQSPHIQPILCFSWNGWITTSLPQQHTHSAANAYIPVHLRKKIKNKTKN